MGRDRIEDHAAAGAEVIVAGDMSSGGSIRVDTNAGEAELYKELERRFGKDLLLEARGQLIGAAYQKALADHELRVVGDPVFPEELGEKMIEAPPDEETGEVPLDAEGMPVMVPEHFFHKAPINGMGQDIGFQCKPCYQNSHCRADIHLFLLEIL